MSLAEVLATHRVVVCVGSGGVGKTTTSAALAVHAAMSGRRVLCMTIDPAKRLANSLGLSELTSEQQVIPPELFAKQGLKCDGTLSAMMLDMKRTFDELVDKHGGSREQKQRILNNRIYQYVSTSLAGTQEYMAMEKLHAVRSDPRYDLIILDTPPTTNALDFLDAPQKLVSAIDSPVMRWFIETLESNKSVSLVGRGAAFLLKGLAKFTGAEFLTLVGEFVSGLNELFGGFRERANIVYEALRSKDVAFVIVTSPSPQAVSEAVYFSRKLSDYGITPRAVVVNRVHAVDAEPTLDDAQIAAALRAQWPASLDPAASVPALREALRDARAQGESDREGVRRLREHVGTSLQYNEVPAFAHDVHDLTALSALSKHLIAP